MDLQAKKRQLIDSLVQIRARVSQLEEELAHRRTQEQQTIGAVMLCDELIAESASTGSGVGTEEELTAGPL